MMRMTRTMPVRSARRGFTLLEVLLASVIGILLMAALYYALNMTLQQTQTTRDSVDADNLARGVFGRINMDLSISLAPLPPKCGGNADPGADPSDTASTSSTSSSTTTTSGNASAVIPTGAGTVAPAPSTSTTTTTTTTTTMTGDPTAAAPQSADIGFQAGIMGTDKQLTVFQSRVPTALSSYDGLTVVPSSDAATPSDLYRVTYWMSQNGGLCRQERPWVTADGIRDSTDPDLSTETTDILASEITDATFEYFDGTSWQSSWNSDGSTMSDDGVTPIGPPRAVRVTLVFSIPSARSNVPPYETTLVKVIPVRAAPGSLTPTMIVPSTDTGSDASTTPAASASASTSNGSGSSGSGGGAAGGGAASGGASGGAASGGTTTGAKTGGTTAPAASSGAKTGGAAAPTPAPAASTGGRSMGGSAMPAPSAPAAPTGGSGANAGGARGGGR